MITGGDGNYDNDKSWDGMIQKVMAMESQLQKFEI